MTPPIIPIPGIPADWDAIGKSVHAANDPDIRRTIVFAVQEWEDEGGRVVPLKPPPRVP